MSFPAGPGSTGDSQPIEPMKPEEMLGVKGAEVSGPQVEEALHTKVRTLGQLKQMLIKALGEKEGKAVYNRFLQSMAMLMIDQLQQSARSASKASKGMSGNQ